MAANLFIAALAYLLADGYQPGRRARRFCWVVCIISLIGVAESAIIALPGFLARLAA